MLKRLISVILAISLVIGMPTITLSASQPKSILNGETVSLDNEIYVNEEGQIMCPLRVFAEKLDRIDPLILDKNSRILSFS